MSKNAHSASVQIYLFFNGNCAEALEFYKTALGAEVLMTMLYKDSPEPPPPGMVPDGYENKIMHTSFRVGESIVMASDGCSAEGRQFNGFSISLTLPNEGEARKAFEALSNGGKVQMPLGRTFWSPCFGMVEDRFGVGWMITIPEDPS